MKRRKIWGIILAAATLAMTFTGCGKKTDSTVGSSSGAMSEEDKNCIYKCSEIEGLMSEGDYMDSVCFAAGNIYATKSAEDGSVILRIPEDTLVPETIELDKKGHNIRAEKITVDEDGNMYIVAYIYDDADGEYIDPETNETFEVTETEGETPEGTEAVEVTEESESTAKATEEVTEEGTSEDAEASDEEEPFFDGVDGSFDSYSYLLKYDAAGNEVWRANLTKEDAESWITSMVYVKDFGVLTCTGAGFSKYSPEDGKGEFLFTRNENEDDYRERSLMNLRDGKTYLSESDDEWNYNYYPFDVKTGNFGAAVSEKAINQSSVYPGKQYDLYYVEDSRIFGINFGDEEGKKICDYALSDFFMYYSSFVCEVANNKLVVKGTEDGSGSERLYVLEKVDPKDVVEKQILTLGTVYIDDSVRKNVIKFNKANDKCKIIIKDYADYEAEDWMQTFESMNLAITSGDVPDIMVLNSYIPYESYIEKGLFEPLDSYLENDPDYANVKYLENVMDAGKRDGKQYILIPAFNTVTCVASKAMLNGETVTLQNFADICKKNNVEISQLIGGQHSDYVDDLYGTMAMSFIDFTKGTCDFDTPEFRSLLEYIGSLPKMPEDYDYSETEMLYREKKAILDAYWVSSFDDYQVLKKGYFGEDIVFNGYPVRDGGMSYISPDIQMAVSKKCADKDSVWEFLRLFLDEEYQKSLRWQFPVREDVLDYKAAEAQEPPYYINDKGEKEPTSNYWSIGNDIEIEMTALTKEETDEVVNFVKSVTEPYHYDQKVINIIKEEAGAYFEGQKTVEEVTQIIQSRISVYLSEMM